jgi:formylglycine-generating enzyme required for sulfatase activity
MLRSRLRPSRAEGGRVAIEIGRYCDITRGDAVARGLALAAWFATPVAVAAPPPIDAPPVSGQKSPKDFAVVIANGDYATLNDVPYAGRDADAFEQWLLSTRGVPTLNLRRQNGATRKKLEDAVAGAAAEVPAGGTLWVYYSGHGLGMRVGGADAEQVLVGVNAVASADEIGEAVVPVSRLEQLASGSKASRVVFVLDACFNNKDASGAPVVRGSFAVPVRRAGGSAKVTVWTASSEDQTAQWYEPAQHGAFTYFAVGALSGWADGVDGVSDGSVTLDEASLFVTRAMARAGITGQSPQLALATGSPVGAVAQGKLATAPGAFGAASQVSQVCDDDAQSKAEAAQASRVSAAVTKAQGEASAAWRALVPDLDACLSRDDRQACIAAAEQFIAAGTTASVTVGESREVVTTACGDRSRVVASRTVPVSVSEVALAEAKLAALKAPKGASGGGAGSDWVSPTLGVMKWIPAGTFTMGSPSLEAGRGDDEVPHRVTLTKGFYLMEHEVTQGQFEAVTARNPATGTKFWDGKEQGACATYEGVSLEGSSYPAICVSWSDAVTYANAVSSREGLTPCYGADGAVVRGCTGYRLPTEAEWERAARGGGAAVYAGTSERGSVCGYGNVADAIAKGRWSNWSVFGCTDGVAGLSAVKSYLPNGYGLYDMTGNVFEWTQDWYGAYAGETVDPTGAASGSNRVSRGGSWGNNHATARVAFRLSNDPGNRRGGLGLRLLRSVP